MACPSRGAVAPLARTPMMIDSLLLQHCCQYQSKGRIMASQEQDCFCSLVYQWFLS